MKSVISVLITVLILIMSLSGCGGDEVVVSYEEREETINADILFEENDAESLKSLCTIMAGNNDNPEIRDNFFYYILIKTAEIAETNQEDKYETVLDVLDTCLDLPLTQYVISDGLRQYYSIIDDKLTLKTKEYLLGKWKRTDSTLLTGTTVEVTEGENGLTAIITGLPEEENLRFKIGDVKWNNIHFANRNMFYFSDLTTEEKKGIETYYKDNASAVYVYSGATGIINFENDTISVKYEKNDMTSGATQLWVKVGSESEDDGYSQLTLENELANASEQLQEEDIMPAEGNTDGPGELAD